MQLSETVTFTTEKKAQHTIANRPFFKGLKTRSHSVKSSAQSDHSDNQAVTSGKNTQNCFQLKLQQDKMIPFEHCWSVLANPKPKSVIMKNKGLLKNVCSRGTPVNFHSVIESPERVSLVMPPRTISVKTQPEQAPSQIDKFCRRSGLKPLTKSGKALCKWCCAVTACLNVCACVKITHVPAQTNTQS
jgi:hypothetical protein